MKHCKDNSCKDNSCKDNFCKSCQNKICVKLDSKDLTLKTKIVGQVGVSNCKNVPLTVKGSVTVSNPVVVDSGCVQVENKEGDALEVTGVVTGCVQVENKEDDELNVVVRNKLCAITEENLDKGRVVNYSTELTRLSTVANNTLSVVVSTGTEVFYPKQLQFTIISPNFIVNGIFNIIFKVADEVSFTADFLICLIGEIETVLLPNDTLFRVTIDLEKVFGSQRLSTLYYPIPIGSILSISFDNAMSNTDGCFSVSGTQRAPQCNNCEFSSVPGEGPGPAPDTDP